MKPSIELNLPEALEAYREAIANTIKSYLKIDIKPSSTQWWESKFGGLPYLPRTINYPTNKKGEYLKLLAQLNFSEIPRLENFPTQGILQFYIDGNDPSYGFDYDVPTNQDGFKILYFEEIVENVNNLVTDFYFLEEHQEYTPIWGEFNLSFTHYYSPTKIYSADFERHFPNFDDDGLLDIYCKWYSKYFEIDGNQHQVGGYPNFTQEDPRFNPEYEDYILLLQIVSDYGSYGEANDICWGDAGIGNFFIKPSQLKALDFSQVLYHWDCH
ncbi:MAG: YwqG family protein [Microcoleaceae cyanobacterium MO_207.B10]|nr:YwqG family protein [Microcoleaceae cyanobacterium MO_207.B10]